MGAPAIVGGLFLGLLGSSKERSARNERDRANRLQETRANVSNRRSIARTLASRRAKVASIRAAGAASGATGSSAVQGGIGGLTTQAFGEVAFSTRVSDLDTRINQRLGTAANLQSQANVFSAFSGAAFSLA